MHNPTVDCISQMAISCLVIAMNKKDVEGHMHVTINFYFSSIGMKVYSVSISCSTNIPV